MAAIDILTSNEILSDTLEYKFYNKHHIPILILGPNDLSGCFKLLNNAVTCRIMNINMTYDEFVQKSNNVFKGTNIRHYEFYNIKITDQRFYSHFSNADSYSINRSTITDEGIAYLRGASSYTLFKCHNLTNKCIKHIAYAKYYNISRCSMLNVDVNYGSYLCDADSYTIGTNSYLKINDIFKYLSNAYCYKFVFASVHKTNEDIFNIPINQNIQHIANGKSYDFENYIIPSEYMRYISFANKYRFSRCNIGKNHLKHISNAKTYIFNNEYHITNKSLRYISDGDYYEFTFNNSFKLTDYSRLGKIKCFVMNIFDAEIKDTIILPDAETYIFRTYSNITSIVQIIKILDSQNKKYTVKRYEDTDINLYVNDTNYTGDGFLKNHHYFNTATFKVNIIKT